MPGGGERPRYRGIWESGDGFFKTNWISGPPGLYQCISLAEMIRQGKRAWIQFERSGNR